MSLPSAQISDKLLVTADMRLFGQRLLNTWCYYVANQSNSTTSWSTVIGELFTIHTAALGLIQNLVDVLPGNCQIQTVNYQVIHPTRYAVDKRTFVQAGDLADATIPNCAAVITRRGDLGSRDNVSALHVPLGADALNVSSGLLETDYLTAIGNLVASCSAGVTTTTGTQVLRPIIFHRSAPTVITPITDAFVQDTSRVMRRRTVRVGE